MVVFLAGFRKVRLFSGFGYRALGPHAEVFEKEILLLVVETTRRSQCHRRCAILAKRSNITRRGKYEFRALII